MRVARQRTRDAQAVGARLLLIDAPLPLGALRLLAVQELEQRGPLDAALDGDGARVRVEVQHAIQIARVDEHRVLGELLTAHGMTAARDRDRSSLPARAGD